MKIPVLTLLTCLLAVTASVHADAPKLHLFLFSGQSNMVLIEPDAAFMPAMRQAFAGDECIAVKWAVGGQEISSWVRLVKDDQGNETPQPAAYFKKIEELVNKELGDRKPDTVTFVWMQGERDARMGKGDAYEAKLRGLFTLVRQQFNRDDIHYVIGRLSDYGVDKPDQLPDWNRIREIQVKVAESLERGAWVNTDDLNETGDGLHYSREGRLELGKRFAEKAVALIRAEK